MFGLFPTTKEMKKLNIAEGQGATFIWAKDRLPNTCVLIHAHTNSDMSTYLIFSFCGRLQGALEQAPKHSTLHVSDNL